MRTSAKKTDFRVGRSGLAYKNGKLYEFTDKHVLVMKGWPDPRAWFKRRSHGWIPTRKWADAMFSSSLFPSNKKAPPEPESPFVLPDGQMILPGVMIREEWIARVAYRDFEVCGSYFNRIPEEIRRELLRYGSRRWHLLNVFARCPGSLDLSRSNPALLYALASNWAFHKPAVTQPIRAARSLVWKKQKAIQEWLGFPGTEPVRRLLAKIAPEAVDVEGLLYLRQALQHPACMKMLSHVPRLNRAAVMLASDRRVIGHVTPKLLEDVMKSSATETASEETDERPDAYRLMLDTVRMATLVDWDKCPKTFYSVKRVQTVHDELSPRMDAARLKQQYNIPDRFRDPPFRGTKHIIPLTTPEEMLREGYLQKNCVGSHVFSVLRGWEYVYRVEQPVRATLAVVFKSGSWMPDELYRACNKPVDLETRRNIFAALFRTRHVVGFSCSKPAATCASEQPERPT